LIGRRGRKSKIIAGRGHELIGIIEGEDATVKVLKEFGKVFKWKVWDEMVIEEV
jgi:hypothetical protein